MVRDQKYEADAPKTGDVVSRGRGLNCSVMLQVVLGRLRFEFLKSFVNAVSVFSLSLFQGQCMACGDAMATVFSCIKYVFQRMTQYGLLIISTKVALFPCITKSNLFVHLIHVSTLVVLAVNLNRASECD